MCRLSGMYKNNKRLGHRQDWASDSPFGDPILFFPIAVGSVGEKDHEGVTNPHNG